jgi:endonuclease/exonuclease/phosphatase (EEP) superfamily protein YafD
VTVLRRVASILVWSYIGFILVWFVSWLFVRDDQFDRLTLEWAPMINRGAVLLFIPAPIAVALAFFGERRSARVASFAPLLLFVGLNWPYVIPQVEPQLDGAPLRVMTYNVLYSNTDYDAVARVIRTAQPDLVALQEVQPEMFRALVERLQVDYPYHLLADRNAYGTTAAFSRYPLRAGYSLDLRYDRPATVLKVDVDGRPVTFISAHLLAYYSALHQARQAQIIIDEALAQDETVVLGCDCNSRETAGSYRMLAQVMTNSARAVGWVPSEPSIAGAQRDVSLWHIDYVFYRGDLKAVEVDTIMDSGGSDHKPVVAILSLETGD